MKDKMLRTALESQDMGTSGVERICKSVKEGTFAFPDDSVSALIVWAVESGEDQDDVTTNFDYAINQLKRAQAAVEKLEENEN